MDKVMCSMVAEPTSVVADPFLPQARGQVLLQVFVRGELQQHFPKNYHSGCSVILFSLGSDNSNLFQPFSFPHLPEWNKWN